VGNLVSGAVGNLVPGAVGNLVPGAVGNLVSEPEELYRVGTPMDRLSAPSPTEQQSFLRGSGGPSPAPSSTAINGSQSVSRADSFSRADRSSSSLSFDPATWIDAIAQIMPKPQLPSPNKTPNKTPPLEARAAVPVGIPEGPLWEFEDGWGNWHPYPSEVNVALRTAGAYEYTALNGATYEVVLSPQKLSGTQTNKATHHTRNVRSVGTPVAISLPASLGAESSSRDPAEAPTTAPTPAPAEHDGDEAPVGRMQVLTTAPAPAQHDSDEGEGDAIEGDEHNGMRSRGAYTALAAAWSSAIMEQRRRDHLPVADAASVAAAAVALAAATCFTPPPILLTPVARPVNEEEGCEEGCEEGGAESSSVHAQLNTSSDAAQPLHTPLHTDAAQPPAACDPLMADGGGDADSPRRGVVEYARKWLWRAPGSVDSLRKRTGTKPR